MNGQLGKHLLRLHAGAQGVDKSAGRVLEASSLQPWGRAFGTIIAALTPTLSTAGQQPLPGSLTSATAPLAAHTASAPSICSTERLRPMDSSTPSSCTAKLHQPRARHASRTAYGQRGGRQRLVGNVQQSCQNARTMHDQAPRLPAADSSTLPASAALAAPTRMPRPGVPQTSSAWSARPTASSATSSTGCWRCSAASSGTKVAAVGASRARHRRLKADWAAAGLPAAHARWMMPLSSCGVGDGEGTLVLGLKSSKSLLARVHWAVPACSVRNEALPTQTTRAGCPLHRSGSSLAQA